jgi:hypothetical protein
MMRMLLVVTQFLAALAACEVHRAMGQEKAAADNPALRQRFLREAPEGWKAYYAKAARLQGTLVVEHSIPGKGVVHQYRNAFKQNPRAALVESQTGANNPIGGAAEYIVENSKYRFTLTRAKDGRPILAKPPMATDAQPPPVKYMMARHIAKTAIAPPVAINHDPDDDWLAFLASTDFTLQSISTGADGLVEVRFSLAWEPTDSTPLRVKEGTAWFDPDHLWTMKRVEYALQSSVGKGMRVARYSATLTYAIQNDGFPLLTKYHQKTLGANQESEYDESMTYDLTFADVPESEFTLSAFGLPEPVGVEWEQPRPRWYLWIMVVAFALLALALTLGYLRKRRSAPPAA